MTSHSRRATLRALAAAGALAAIPAALPSNAVAQSADNFPSKPIKIIVAFGPGSGNDVTARNLAQALTPVLGQPVIVENRTGAGGLLGTEVVVKADPDGYTVGLGTSSQLVYNVALYKLPFDVDRDIATVGLISRSPFVLVANPKIGPTLKDMIAYAKANPGKLTFGSGGNGSSPHIVAEDFKKKAGVFITHIPYRGNGPATTDLIAGHIDLLFDLLVTAAPLAEQGRVRLLAVSTKPNARMPNVPTFAEAGLPGFEAYTWNNLFVPAKTPPAIIAKLNAALKTVMATQQFRDTIEKSGADVIGPGTPAEADAFGVAERGKYVKFIRDMNLKLD